MTSSLADTDGTIEIRGPHRIDLETLRRYLDGRVDGVADRFDVRQFQGGQSNPTYLITTGTGRFVLRKKPPGKLLPKAHAVEREYRVMKALADTDVPVPQMRLLCEDESVVGTPFFVMDFVDARVETDPGLAGMGRAERRPLYHSAVATLAALHSVDVEAVGLSDFGRPTSYVERQFNAWGKSYRTTETDPIPAMDRLMAWIPDHLPQADETAIVHGDFRMGNLMLDHDVPKVAAVLDWELGTLGHPLSDLGYFCTPFHLPNGIPGVRGVLGLDLTAQDLPDRDWVVETYCALTGRDGVPDIDFYVAFNLFRLAAILQGVYARGMAGNAANSDAAEVGKRAGLMAETGWAIASQS
ncbi:MAG: phosphotransferase family protein [Alphaproteobacteria bacterium]|nr:phosphotransferase family protein [Alphaproteobacteria bacterium]